jgi:hypothetical protein
MPAAQTGTQLMHGEPAPMCWGSNIPLFPAASSQPHGLSCAAIAAVAVVAPAGPQHKRPPMWRNKAWLMCHKPHAAGAVSAECWGLSAVDPAWTPLMP